MTHRFPVAALLCRFDNDTGLMAEHVGVSHRTVNRWLFEGGIPEDDADRVAVACGMHPILVWGDEWVARYVGPCEQPTLWDV